MSLERKWERPETIVIEVTRTGNFVSARIRKKRGQSRLFPPENRAEKEGRSAGVFQWLQEFLAAWLEIELPKSGNQHAAEFVAEVESMIRGMSAGRYRRRYR